MKPTTLALGFVWGSLLTGSASSVVTWDGGGDGTTWSSPLNWSGDFVPTTTNDVVLGTGAAVMISGGSFTVLSVQSQRPLSLTSGSLTVTAGASEVDGALTLAAGSSLSVNGASATFVATNAANVGGASLYALNGGRLSLPSITTVVKSGCSDAVWQANGTGSVLDLSTVTNLDAGICGVMRLQAYNGGQVIVSNLVSLTNGNVQAYAEGANAIVDLRNLPAFSYSNPNQILDLEARNSGRVIMPLVTDGKQIRLVLRTGGVLDTAQFVRLLAVTVDTSVLTLPGMTNADGTSLFALNGGRLSLPLITAVIKSGCGDAVWQANGTGSMLDLSAVTNLNMNNCGVMRLQAYNGGQVIVSNLVSLTNGNVQAYADGANAVVDLRNLSAYSYSNPNQLFDLEARNSGRVIMPLMTDGKQIRLFLRTGGVLDTAQFVRLLAVTVDSTLLSLPAVTNIDGISLFALSGGRLSLPLITKVIKSGCSDAVWQANGTGSVLDLSTVTNLDAGNCGVMRLQAYNGGQVIVSNLVSLTNGNVQAYAEGANAVVDLRNLPAFSYSNPNQILDLEARNSGRVIMPLLTDGKQIRLFLRTGGVLDTAQFVRLLAATVDTSVLTLPAVTNIDGISLFALNGGRLSLPLITTVIKSGCSDAVWQANGVSSVLDLSTVTNLNAGNCAVMRLQAYFGGQVIVSNLVSLTNGNVQVYAEGANAVVDLRNLPAYSYSNPNQLFDLEARNSGRVIMPLVTDGKQIRLFLRTGGVLDAAQFTRLASVTIDNSTLSLTSVTNLDGAPLQVITGGKLTLPALLSETKTGCSDVHWQASGTGSRIEAPALAKVAGGTCATFFLEALSGGQLVFSNLLSLSGSTVAVLADGASSVIDLSRLTSFIGPPSPASSLTARNGGVILLGTQAFLLANVNVNIPPGNPVLPPVFISGPNLTLYGAAWHSYLIERSSTLVPDSPWTGFARVPLTNSFQAISGSPPANTAFRITELLADPPILEIFNLPAKQVGLLLYGTPTNSYLIQTCTHLDGDVEWATNSVAIMSNSFRIFPPAPGADPMRFFRAKKL